MGGLGRRLEGRKRVGGGRGEGEVRVKRCDGGEDGGVRDWGRAEGAVKEEAQEVVRGKVVEEAGVVEGGGGVGGKLVGEKGGG